MKRSKWSLSSKIHCSMLIQVVIIIVLTGLISLYFALTIKQNDMDLTIKNLASMTSGMDMVKEVLREKKNDSHLEEELDLLVSSFEMVDVLVVCDTDSIRYYHNNKERIGQRFSGEDQYEILQGAAPYISEAMGTLGWQRRAFYPVNDDDGTLLGFVVASVLTVSLDHIRNRIIIAFAVFLIIMLIFSFGISTLIHHFLKKTLMGYEPEAFRDRFIEREEVLDALEEGIFAIDLDGNTILINDSARKMVGAEKDDPLEGKPLAVIFPETCLPHILETKKPEYNINFNINEHRIISSRIPIMNEDKLIGAVSIFRDKTEVMELADELTGTQYMVDALRAFNHDFMNKLHVILGFLETGDIDNAKSYILKNSMTSEKAVSEIVHQIPIPTLSALIIGKMIRANELGINLIFKSDSYFYTKEKQLPVDCFITLVGNLLENAMDELNSKDFPLKEIELGIYSEEGHTTIVCDDTGGGIPEEILFSLYDRHTTTKGEGHGNGFALMKEIVDIYQGTFHIDTEIGEGTSVEIFLPV